MCAHHSVVQRGFLVAVGCIHVRARLQQHAGNLGVAAEACEVERRLLLGVQDVHIDDGGDGFSGPKYHDFQNFQCLHLLLGRQRAYENVYHGVAVLVGHGGARGEPLEEDYAQLEATVQCSVMEGHPTKLVWAVHLIHLQHEFVAVEFGPIDGKPVNLVSAEVGALDTQKHVVVVLQQRQRVPMPPCQGVGCIVRAGLDFRAEVGRWDLQGFGGGKR
mmetsp:Transcript_22271/g.55870  ORF Transcript_22271/g.55870 Transcript_22271/m.55870 type:complete len:217 (+) Transcript_22271:437-1087(+)